MRNLKSWMLGGTSLVATAMVFATTLQAQEAGGLEEIVVTAQRREERLQNVPISVTALSPAMLESRGITDITRLDVATPGFSFARSGSDARPAMRGVRTENVGINGDTTIGFFIDGIYQSRSQQAMAGFVDVERVEILRPVPWSSGIR